MKRRIKAAKITTIALCRMGKNGFQTLLKADGSLELTTLVKSQGSELLAVVYAPEKADYDGDVADADVIKAAAYEYLRDHRALDIEHDGKKLSEKDAYVAESFIVAKGDERFLNWKDYDGNDVGDLTGAWATVIALPNEKLRLAYQRGELNGVSMFGKAAAEPVLDIKAAAQRVADKLGSKEQEMDETKLKALLEGFKADVVTMVKSVVADLVPKAEPKPETKAKDEKPALPEPPQFTGDASNPKDLEAFETQLRGYELTKALASGQLTADKIAEMRKALTTKNPSDEEAGIDAADSQEVRSLKLQLFKAQKARNAPEAHGNSTQLDVVDEQLAANAAEGAEIAKCFSSRTTGGGMRVVNKS